MTTITLNILLVACKYVTIPNLFKLIIRSSSDYTSTSQILFQSFVARPDSDPILNTEF